MRASTGSTWSQWAVSIAAAIGIATVSACSGDSGSDDPGAHAGSAGASAGSAAANAASESAPPSSGGKGAAGMPSAEPGATFGKSYEGGEFHLGPVDWDETQWHNACAPGTKYAAKIRAAEGDLLAGLWNGIPDVAGYCDACIHVTTARGKSATLRVVTYGDTSTNSIDVSPQAFALLDSGESPRSMHWELSECPESGSVYYELQTGSSQWWTSLWVRNARVPLRKVEVKSANHDDFVELQRGSDGTLTDAGGFGEGPFTFRLSGVDGSVHMDNFEWPEGGVAGKMLEGKGNF
jgi:expansin (peptidoglycan-binding protein)